ncbi:hypothetical protein WH221_21715 [Chryseobacterium culicis]|uniref:Uncharacterized protein n=1 Tax=Chryseobacterium culicis TaxID=680127 RepID=A0A2S9CJV8_CHRCI|nr:hypothetical protein [Chryseobacterium culicis]PRB80802.1 hypothetical protein CQ022_21645 [Chryseobacterium culicis]PRB87651.1 hypothetical protein CQ033_21650 [Chryseobacterium culicis]
MKKAKFNSTAFYYVLIVLFVALIIYNTYVLFTSLDYFIVVPIIIPLFLLVLIFVKYTKIKLILKIWTMIFLIIAPGMQLIGKLLKDASYDYQYFDINIYITPLLMFIVGVLILYFIIKTVDNEN